MALDIQRRKVTVLVLKKLAALGGGRQKVVCNTVLYKDYRGKKTE